MKSILVLPAALIAMSSFASVPAHAQGFRELMEDIGLEKRKKERIDYNERAPLVVPPSVETLPPPEDSGALAKANPQWPTDPDILKEQQDAEREPNEVKDKAYAAQDIYKIRAEEKDRAHSAGSSTYDPAADSRALSPNELREVRNKRAKEAAEAGPVVMVEPERKRLTDPPAGYRVPSPNQPYGPGEEAKKKGVLSKLNPFD